MVINAGNTYYKEINDTIRTSKSKEITVNGMLGQRYLGCGSSGKKFVLHGTPGNGLGQYLNGSDIEVHGNAQDAVGDTMNDGDIIIHGNCGDTCGYGMRGGRIFIRDNCGYRCGIHMKSYLDKNPVIVVGGQCGSFLGEYLAGGLILVLGNDANGLPPVGYFTGTGMHGGKIVLACQHAPEHLPLQVMIHEATSEDILEITPYIESYCKFFGGKVKEYTTRRFFVLTPNPSAGYKQLYTNE